MKERDELHLALNSFIGEFMKKIALVLTALFALSSVAFAEEPTKAAGETAAAGENPAAAGEKEAPKTKKGHKGHKGHKDHNGHHKANDEANNEANK